MKLRFPGFKDLQTATYWGKFLATYFFAIAMIIVVVVLFDYVEKIDDFTELHAPLNEVIFDYYLNFIPFFINQFSGLFTFIACIFFTSKMAYQTEIVAMLSGGMSFRRLMWPYFLGALIIGSLSLTLNLWLIPISQRHIVNFESQYIKRKQNAKFNRHIYRQIEPGTFAYIRGYNDGSQQASFLALERVLQRHDDPLARSGRREIQPRDQTLDGTALHQARVRLAGHRRNSSSSATSTR